MLSNSPSLTEDSRLGRDEMQYELPPLENANFVILYDDDTGEIINSLGSGIEPTT